MTSHSTQGLGPVHRVGARCFCIDARTSRSFRCEENVGTRLDLLRSGKVDALVLAVAGLKRLHNPSDYMPISESRMCPAAGQGVIGVQVRVGDEHATNLAMRINDPSTTMEIQAERAFVAALGASCDTPIGAFAKVRMNTIYLQTMILSVNGRRVQRACGKGPAIDAADLGTRLGICETSLSRFCR